MTIDCDFVTGDVRGELSGCQACAYANGAAVAFGLMGMAEAIRLRAIPDHVNEWCGRCVGLEQAHHPDCNWAP